MLASGLITLGVMLDPDALTTRQPRKGYIKKALEKTREELEQQINQRAELQSFYETELHRMTGVLEEEESVLEEVLGDDYVNTVAKHNKHSQPSPHRL